MSTPDRSLWFPRWHLVAAGGVLWGLAACQTTPPKGRIPPSPPPVANETGIPAGARAWPVATGDSLLQIFVLRGGAMSRLGHNHVIASRQLVGTVYVTDDPLATRFDVRFPVNELTIDEPALREQAGPEFAAAVPQTAREGTRNNLLSEALLDGAHHPEIRLRATDVKAAGDAYDVGVEISIQGRTHAVRVPAHVTRAAGALLATGEFPLRQSELGLKPFSVAMGTLIVVDEMRVKFELRARE